MIVLRSREELVLREVDIDEPDVVARYRASNFAGASHASHPIVGATIASERGVLI